MAPSKLEDAGRRASAVAEKTTLTMRDAFAETIAFEEANPAATAILPLAARRAAFERFEELAVPGGRPGRGWKHDYEKLATGLDLGGEPAGIEGWALDVAALDKAAHIVMCDPLVRAGEDAPPHDAGFFVSHWRALPQPARALLADTFGRAVSWQDDKFAALAVALANTGVMIRVPAHTRIAMPIVISHAAGRLNFPYVLVVLEAGAEATVVEHVTGSPALTCGIVEAIVGDGARLDYVVAQQLGPAARSIMNRGAVCGADASCHWFVAELGGALTRSVVSTRLAGRGANAELDGLFFSNGRQHVDLATNVEHAVGPTTSRTAIKSAANGAGQGRYYGNIRIDAHAAGSDATLRDDTLLLSKGAHIDSVPALEIASNDVKAFHGATVGTIDAEELFYAESRGISRAAAERMIALGFFEPIAGRFALAPVREALERALSAKLDAERPGGDEEAP